MSSIVIQCKNQLELQKEFYLKHKIHIPVIAWEDKTFIRISMQVYNSMEDIDKLIFALKELNLLK